MWRERKINMEKEQIKTGYPSIDKPWLKYYKKEALSIAFPKMTMFDYLYQNNRNHLDDTAILYQPDELEKKKAEKKIPFLSYLKCERNISYRELFQRIETTARAFAQLGVKAGDIVTICSPGIPEVIYAFYALNRMGAIANVIHPLSSEEEMLNYLRNTDTNVLVMFYPFRNRIRAILDKTAVSTVVLADAAESLLRMVKYAARKKNPLEEYSDRRLMNWDDFYRAGKSGNREAWPKYEENRPCAITYTSGTTGTPKGAVFSDDGFNAMVHQIRHSTELLERGDRELLLVHPFPVYSLCNQVHMPLSLGITTIVIPDLKAERVNYYVEKYRINHLQGLPSQYQVMFRQTGVDYSSVKFLVSGGDVLSASLAEKINSGLRAGGSDAIVTNGYGMTEMGSCATCTFNQKMEGAGIPLFGNNVRITELGQGEQELQVNQEGEIYLTGPAMMLGYYKREKESQELFFTDDTGRRWIRTGDVGRVDENGNVIVCGRIKRMSLVMDQETGISSKVNHGDVENVIRMDEDVLDCAVVSIPDENNYKILKAYLVCRGSDDQSVIRRVDAACHRILRKNFSPKEYVVLESLPVDRNGKVDYRGLEGKRVN